MLVASVRINDFNVQTTKTFSFHFGHLIDIKSHIEKNLGERNQIKSLRRERKKLLRFNRLYYYFFFLLLFFYIFGVMKTIFFFYKWEIYSSMVFYCIGDIYFELYCGQGMRNEKAIKKIC